MARAALGTEEVQVESAPSLNMAAHNPVASDEASLTILVALRASTWPSPSWLKRASGNVISHR